MYGLFKRLNMSSPNLRNRLENFLVPNWTSSMDWVVSSSQEQIFRNQVYALYLPWQMGNYAGNYMKLHHDESRLQQNPSNFVWTTWTSSQVFELFEKRVKLAVTIKKPLLHFKLLRKKHVIFKCASKSGVSSRPRYDEIKLTLKNFFLYPNKRQRDTLLTLFVRFRTCLLSFQTIAQEPVSLWSAVEMQ